MRDSVRVSTASIQITFSIVITIYRQEEDCKVFCYQWKYIVEADNEYDYTSHARIAHQKFFNIILSEKGLKRVSIWRLRVAAIKYV